MTLPNASYVSVHGVNRAEVNAQMLNGVTPPNEKYLASTLRMLKMSVTTPVVPVHTQDHAKSRQLLMETVYGLSPRLKKAAKPIQLPLLNGKDKDKRTLP